MRKPPSGGKRVAAEPPEASLGHAILGRYTTRKRFPCRFIGANRGHSAYETTFTLGQPVSQLLCGSPATFEGLHQTVSFGITNSL
jgi:hypothetical protein